MPRTTVVIVGAGHAGLAMSWHLARLGLDHVVLERGEVANTWRTERWESLRLLTPNWQSRLPGNGYEGDDPDGFRSMPETVAFIERYARMMSAPVETWTNVISVRPMDKGYRVGTNRGEWCCRAVVVASGACNLACVPACAGNLPARIRTVVPTRYRAPDRLSPGGVLVVGASATGVQLADEIRRSGRHVILSCGEHVRVPRTYRGRDILWWMDRTGIFDQRHDAVDDIARVRGLPSFQLVGERERGALDLNALAEIGVELVGRLVGLREGRLLFSGSLHNQARLADLKLTRLLDAIDAWADAQRFDGTDLPPSRYAPTRVPEKPRLGIDLAGGEIETIVWATGFRPDHSWLDVDVLDQKGRVRHQGGVTSAPGLYVMGQPFLRRRKSTLIDGAGDDALELSAHLELYLAGRSCGTITATEARVADFA